MPIAVGALLSNLDDDESDEFEDLDSPLDTEDSGQGTSDFELSMEKFMAELGDAGEDDEPVFQIPAERGKALTRLQWLGIGERQHGLGAVQ